MEINEELAEFLGAFIGDGCLSRYKRSNRPKGEITEVVFTGGWEKDSPYYRDIIGPILQKNFQVSGSLKHRVDDNSVRFRIFNKSISSFLIEVGFKPGPKSKNVKIPEAIMNDSSLHQAVLRGIFNTDGTVYRRYSKRYGAQKKEYLGYKVVQFKSMSKGLIFQIHELLESLGLNPNKVTASREAWVCRITSQEEVSKFGKEIATDHPYHMDRFAK